MVFVVELSFRTVVPVLLLLALLLLLLLQTPGFRTCGAPLRPWSGLIPTANGWVSSNTNTAVIKFAGSVHLIGCFLNMSINNFFLGCG